MELNINNDTVVKNLQAQFNNLYPYLKIEFLAAPKRQNGYSRAEKVPASATFRALYTLDKEVAIDVNRNRTVAEVEHDFKENTGLSIQLYRKSGNVWIETSLTDDWTLGRQNDAGEVLSFYHLQKSTG
ncbi:hypothetical protein [Aridibaculum aurantiacum]|uniref:hypothetical protein n=1 Tax=Aridibaculum aurantiacum TaxID=2810307 RepID=UPI001A960E28|nr:hypothetical protein [Aridibaculum aurantiacum]